MSNYTDPEVQRVVSEVGMGHGAWDMVDPREIIQAAQKPLRDEIARLREHNQVLWEECKARRPEEGCRPPTQGHGMTPEELSRAADNVESPPSGDGCGCAPILRSAAAEITRLREHNRVLREECNKARSILGPFGTLRPDVIHEDGLMYEDARRATDASEAMEDKPIPSDAERIGRVVMEVWERGGGIDAFGTSGIIGLYVDGRSYGAPRLSRLPDRFEAALKAAKGGEE